jgi:hypothetical protein
MANFLKGSYCKKTHGDSLTAYTKTKTVNSDRLLDGSYRKKTNVDGLMECKKDHTKIIQSTVVGLLEGSYRNNTHTLSFECIFQ